MGAKNLQIFNNVGRMLLFDHLDNFEITLIRAPFSSRRRWLSFFKCSSCYKNKKKCHYINALAFRNYPLKLAVKRQCYAVREKSRQDLNNGHPNDRQIRIADNIQVYAFLEPRFDHQCFVNLHLNSGQKCLLFRSGAEQRTHVHALDPTCNQMCATWQKVFEKNYNCKSGFI